MKKNGQDWSGNKFEVLNDAVYEGEIKDGLPLGQGHSTYTLMVLYMQESSRMGKDIDKAATPSLIVLYNVHI